MSLATKTTEIRGTNAVVEGKIINLDNLDPEISSKYNPESNYIASRDFPIPFGVGSLFDGKYEYVLFGMLNGEPNKEEIILCRNYLELRLPCSPGIFPNSEDIEIDTRSIFMKDGRVFINRRDLRDIAHLNTIFSKEVIAQIKRRLNSNNRQS